MEPAILVTEEKSYSSTDIFTDDMKENYQAAKDITVELVERTTTETDVSSETVYDRYLVSDVIKLMLSGETYDEITAQNVYVQVSKDGLPEYFSAEVTYRYNDWMITKSLYLQVTIEDREEGANEN